MAGLTGCTMVVPANFLALGFLVPYFQTALHAVFNTSGVEGAADGVITHTWQVFDSTAANQDHGVFLQLVTFTTNVGSHFVAIGQTNTTDLTR